MKMQIKYLTYSLNLKNKDRVIIFATHNRFFANKADYKISLSNGKIKTINGKI